MNYLMSKDTLTKETRPPTDIVLPVPGTSVGQSFHVNASLDSKAETFSIELVDLNTTEIYLRIQVNFTDSTVETNAALELDAGWGKPETSDEFPFTRPMDFDLVITVETSHFNVLINGNTFCIFRHRHAFFHINAIKVHGTITVKYIEVNTAEVGVKSNGSQEGAAPTTPSAKLIAKYPPLPPEPVIELHASAISTPAVSKEMLLTATKLASPERASSMQKLTSTAPEVSPDKSTSPPEKVHSSENGRPTILKNNSSITRLDSKTRVALIEERKDVTEKKIAVSEVAQESKQVRSAETAIQVHSAQTKKTDNSPSSHKTETSNERPNSNSPPPGPPRCCIIV